MKTVADTDFTEMEVQLLKSKQGNVCARNDQRQLNIKASSQNKKTHTNHFNVAI